MTQSRADRSAILGVNSIPSARAPVRPSCRPPPRRPAGRGAQCGLEEERIAREIAAGTHKPPEPPDPDYMPENVIDVDSYILKLDGDRNGWKERQLFLKRDLAEMIRRDWPGIDAEPNEPPPGKGAHDDQESNPPA